MSGKHPDQSLQLLADQSLVAQSGHGSCPLDAIRTATYQVYTSCAAIGKDLKTVLAAVTEVSSRADMQSEEVLQRVEDLRQSVEQPQSLAILGHAIHYFRIDVAYSLGFSDWHALSDRLFYERRMRDYPTHAELEVVLTDKNLSMKVWNDVTLITEAGCVKATHGPDLDPMLLFQLVDEGLLTDDLSHTKDSMKRMLQYVSTVQQAPSA